MTDDANAKRSANLDSLGRDLSNCRRCPRLVAWREEVAATKVARFADQDYWGRPVPGFGDPGARILLLGLAPAAHGANRTGRMFTGDRSGDWLFEAMAQVGMANQANAVSADDGLELSDVYLTSTVHCAPPANKPTPAERRECSSWVAAEIDALAPLVILCLGAFAFDQTMRMLREQGAPVPVPRTRFGHGVEVDTGEGFPAVVASYHPSQHNTFTGRLTQDMLQATLRRARELADQRSAGVSSQ